MGYVQRFVVFLVLVVAVIQMPIAAMAAEPPGLQYVHTPQRFDGSTDQLVVRLQPGLQRSSADTGFWRQFSQSARNETAVSARYQRQFRDDTHILRVSRNLDVKQLDAVIKAWSRIPGVELVEPDVRTFPIATPNDTYYSYQWPLVESGTVIGGKTYYGIGVETAWDSGYTGDGAVVAVIDTGILPHPDLAGQVIGQYDFISYTSVSGDGDGRDSDATDEGDYGCDGPTDYSSWHGTHVAGTIAAVTNNGAGVAGVAPDAKLIIGRVLGTCGGYPSDIADAILWAAGVGSPSNPNPADVINLSLGGVAPYCPSYYSDAIAAAKAAGTTVVIAAGNSNMDTSGFTPANCSGALTVASTGGTGKRAFYSNYGELVDVAAPGGDSLVATTVLSTWYSGLTTNTSGSYGYAYMQGTSMATPHVAGIAALWYGSDPTLTPAEVAANIIDTAQPFPTDASSTGCAVLLCGSGIASAANMLPAQTFTTALPTTVVYKETTDLVATSDQAISGTWSVDAGSTRICSLDGTTVTGLLPGDCVLNYTNSGSTDYRRLHMSHTIVVEKAEQSITASPLPTNVIGTSTSGAFLLTSDEGLRGKWTTTTPEFCKVLGSRIRGVAPGSCEVVFTQTGNTYYKPFVYTDTVTIDPKLTQSFTTGLPASVTGTSSSTAFAIASDEGLKGRWTTTDRTICRMRGSNIVTGVAPGTCTVVFSNKGSDMYESFVYTGTITIDPKLTQTYTTAMPADVIGTNTSGAMGLTSDEGLKGKWTTTDRTICRMRGSNIVMGVAPGTCTVVFSNKGSSIYESFVYTDTITILPKLTQSFTSAIPANVVGTDTSAAISLYSDEGIKGIWTTTNRTVCMVLGGNKIRGVSPGACVLQYTNRGNSTYEAVVSSSPITTTVTIDPKSTQTFSGVVPSTMTIAETFAAVFATDEGIALQVGASPSAVCFLGSGVVTARAAGTCTVTVSNRGSPVYEPFTQTFTITVSP